MTFLNRLEIELHVSQSHNYGADNWDHYRFGKLVRKKTTFKKKLKSLIKRFIYKPKELQPTGSLIITNYLSELIEFYDLLSDHDKNLLIKLLAYRILGYKKVKLPLNTPSYWEKYEGLSSKMDRTDSINPGFMDFILYRFDLKELGYDSKLYFMPMGIMADFILEQYAYRAEEFNVQAEQGDFVIDAGACWGDSAIYFANKVGETGRVFSFEFIPENLRIFLKNLELNPNLKSRVLLQESPVSENTGVKMYFKDCGPASKLELQPFEGQTGETTTLSIDDFVSLKNISRIDFIKMDIEGAEPFALKGAINTIRKFKPKLAIAIYHSMDDFVRIPLWINALGLGYKLYLGHYTIHQEETVIFAKVDK